jgi:hypothetical protein
VRAVRYKADTLNEGGIGGGKEAELVKKQARVRDYVVRLLCL